MKIVLVSFLILLGFGLMTTNAYAENVPTWVKNNAGWWATDAISEEEFVNAIEFLINNGIITVDNVGMVSEKSGNVPTWVKNNAGWWATDKISENEFVNAIEFLINNGIITVDSDCKFKGDNYSHLTEQKKIYFLLCNNIDLKFIHETVDPETTRDRILIESQFNSDGFRSHEIIKKNDNTYRIFLIGGSTMFGAGVYDEHTISTFLQKKYDESVFNINVEVINAGIAASWSKNEQKLIKEKLINYEPDLFIIYDGWNDLSHYTGDAYTQGIDLETRNEFNEMYWRDGWTEICELGLENNFDTIITLQPILGTGERILTVQEKSNLHARYALFEYIQLYPLYAKTLDDLNNTCTITLDMRNVFDDIYQPIYYDQGHVGELGNKIIAEKFYNESLPLVLKKYGIEYDISDHDTLIQKHQQYIIPNELDFRGQIINGKDFSGMNLENADFSFSTITNTDFIDSDLTNSKFMYTIIQNTNFESSELTNSNFSMSNILSTSFSNTNLDYAKIAGSEISDSSFLNSNMRNADIKGTILLSVDMFHTDLTNADLFQSRLYDIDFTEVVLKNTKMNNVRLYATMFGALDLSVVDFSGDRSYVGEPTVLGSSIFDYADFSDVKMSNINVTPQGFQIDTGERLTLKGTQLNWINLSGKDLSTVIFSTDDAVIEDSSGKIINDYTDNELKNIISWRDSYSPNFSFSDLSNTDLSNKNLNFVIFTNTDLSNTNLTNAKLQFTDLRFADLTGADLTGANLEQANLDSAILTNTKLNCINHEICIP